MNPFTELQAACRVRPPVALIVLGSGLGALAADVRTTVAASFADVPGMESASVPGHAGRLTLGDWNGRRVLVQEGRLHFYEGHAWEVVVRFMRFAADLGVRHAVLTNAVGGIGDGPEPGSLMAVRDQFDVIGPDAWRRPKPRRPSPYCPLLLGKIHDAAQAAGVPLTSGCYAAVTGPCYETPAEIRLLRAWGADAVGMSTAREIEAGAAVGLRCAAISCVTNRAAGLADGSLHHDDVLAAARGFVERIGRILAELLPRLDAETVHAAPA
jgi:purine-nucleoside phosphorylase